MYFDYVWTNNKTMNDHLVLLSDANMSESLKMSIATHMYSDLLTNVPLFQDISEVMLCKLCGCIRTEIFMPGDFIVKAGDDVYFVYVVFRGTVEIINDNGIVFLSSGDCFGEYSVLTERKRSRNVRACTICELCEINQENFWEMIVEDKEFATNLKSLTLNRMAHSYRAIYSAETARLAVCLSPP